MSHDEPPMMGRWERLLLSYTIWIWLSPLIGLLLVLLLYFTLASSGRVATTNTASGPAQTQESGAESARQSLSRQTGLSACRSALQQINTELSEKTASRPPALTNEQKDWLRSHLNLDDEEMKEVESSHFSRLDAHHLFRCFLMRDVASALEIKGVRGKVGGPVVREKPLDQAARAFAWVMREVRLRPSEGETEPPSYVVRRGWGTALDRALIFLALLEQLGDREAPEPELLGFLLQIPDKSGTMRLWACGVVIGDDKEVYLFDPSLGLPLPGPNGAGIATLAQVRRQPELLSQLHAGEKYRYPVTTEQARTAQAHLVTPLSALAPRMRYLQDKLLAPAVRVRLAGDASKEVERIQAAFSAGSEKPIPVLMPKDKCTLLRRFLPVNEGGADASDREMRRFMGNLVPWNTLPAVFKNEQLFPAKSALREKVYDRFATHFVAWAAFPNSSRELLLRGRYRSAVEKLVNERDNLTNQLQQRENAADLEGQFQRWLEKATAAYAHQIKAKGPQEREQADREVGAVWRDQSSWPIHIVINSSAAVVRKVEVDYQLGLCSQEQAEQLQGRVDLHAQTGAEPYRPDVEKAQVAWRKVLENWQRFDENVPAQNADRPAARLLRARAESMLGNHQAALASWKAVASWKDEPGAPNDLERIAASYLAQQAEKQHAAKGK